jgi:hypothetical protein
MEQLFSVTRGIGRSRRQDAEARACLRRTTLDLVAREQAAIALRTDDHQ